MSLPWPEQVTVFATPTQLHVSRCVRGWRSRVEERWIEPCGEGTPAALAVPAALAAALMRSRPAAHERRGWMPRPLLRVLLSHHLAPLTLVAQARELLSDEERQAAARHAFAAIYGAATADWQIVVDNGPGNGALAAGLDLALVEGLRRAASAAGFALRSIEPAISAAASTPQGSKEAGWLVVAEPGRIVLARRHGRVWHSIRTQRPRRSLAEDLGPWIDQARLIDGIEGPDRITVVETQPHELGALQRPGWTLVQTTLPEAA